MPPASRKCYARNRHGKRRQWGGRACCWGTRVGLYILVVKGPCRRGRCILAGLLLRGNNGLQVLALPPLLASISVRRLRDLLRLVDGRLFDVGAIHGALVRFPATRWAAAWDRVSRGGGLRYCDVRSGAAVAVCWAHGRAAGDGAIEMHRRVPRAEWLLLHCTAISSIAGRSA